MGSIENWLIEGVQDDDADIRSDAIQDLKRNLAMLKINMKWN